MKGAPRKLGWLLLAAACLAGSGLIQRALDRQRPALGMSVTGADLKGAPPMLAFATVALGGFRGLIANALWIRAMRLQEEDKFFEMAQLADWITKLQPRLKQVWVVQAWNMSYNISVKFSEPEDRWRWVQRGIGLLRDEGLRYNPDEPLIYRELAWHFLHKLGQDLDDAHFYYKFQWAQEMTAVLGDQRDGYLALIAPATEEARNRAAVLREKYKMDPAQMKKTDAEYGPLDWRLPETHAIYWAKLGLEKCRPQDLMPLRRMVYQSLLLSFQRGRLVMGRAGNRPILGPNLDIIPRAYAVYDQMAREEPASADNVRRAQRNFLRQAVEHLYAHNRQAEALRWFQVLREKYPDDPEVQAAAGDLDTFCLRRFTEAVSEAGRNRTQAIIEGYLRTAYLDLALDYDDRAEGLLVMARKIWLRYQSGLGERNIGRLGLPELAEMSRLMLEQLLAPGALDPRLQENLRLKTGAKTVPSPAANPP